MRFFFLFSENTSERYFIPAVLNFYNTLCTLHIASKEPKGQKGIPGYDLDENKFVYQIYVIH